MLRMLKLKSDIMTCNNISRRKFLKRSIYAGSALSLAVSGCNPASEQTAANKRPNFISMLSDDQHPNILWITCEDISPYLGCYGFEQAQTPHLDKLARRGVRFTHAYANAPVCAVARSTLLTGMYASTIGTHQMRSRPKLPDCIPAYPKLFRKAGYYCTNNVKTDYNSSYERQKHKIWDACSRKAHWKNRPAGKPFFAVFNWTGSHESNLTPQKIQSRIKAGEIPETPRIRLKEIELPGYHPDLPEIRRDWARLHDLITLMDSNTGRLIREVEDAGLADDTIIVFYSDHGGMLSRSKRYIYNGGTQVPFIVHVPTKWQQHLIGMEPGSVNDELVSFVDFPKTFLSIAGIKPPELMQGRVFLGPQKEPAPSTVHFYRDRMAERYDFCRATTDGRFYLIRNFMPHRPRGRDAMYGYKVQPNWGAWRDWYDNSPETAGAIRSQFFRKKPVVQLFDTVADPYQVKNLADEPAYAKHRARLEKDLFEWIVKTRDTGLVPEPMFYELIGKGKAVDTVYEYAQSKEYPVEEILAAAKIASAAGETRNAEVCLDMLKHDHPVMRYWGAYGLFLARDSRMAVKTVLTAMAKNDAYATNRIMAGQALGLCGDPEVAFKTIYKEATETKDGYISLFALNAFQYSHTDDRLSKEDWRKFNKKETQKSGIYDTTGFSYSKRIIQEAIALWPKRPVVD